MKRLKTKLKVKAAVPVVVNESVPASEGIDWSKCCFCQELGGNLVCPGNNPNVAIRNKGYESIAANLNRLVKYRYSFPSKYPITCLDDGRGIQITLQENKAKWHKKCALNYGGNKIDLIIKRLSEKPPELCINEASTSVSQPHELPSKSTRSKVDIVKPKEIKCFICKKEGTKKEPLHLSETPDFYNTIKSYAEILCDTELLAVLYTQGDLIAQEGRYHRLCLSRLYTAARKKSSSKKEHEVDEEIACEGLAFADLLMYMEGELKRFQRNCVFRMGQLRKLYKSRLTQLLGREPEGEIQTQRFRQKILTHFTDLKEHKSGKEYILLPNNLNVMNNINNSDQDEDALAVNRFVKNVRKTILSSEIAFKGEFEKDCEEKTIPNALLALVNMLLWGSAVQNDCRASKPALSICQLIIFNMRQTVPKGNVVRHTRTLEPPLPVYLGLSIYAQSREKKHIDELHEYGICISSNRVQEITSQLSRMVVGRGREEGVVCPSQLKKGLFTVAAVDNIDYNPSSTTSIGSFHGTGISIFQMPNKDNDSNPRTFEYNYQQAEIPGCRLVPSLPDDFAVVPECILREKQPLPTPCSIEVASEMQILGNL